MVSNAKQAFMLNATNLSAMLVHSYSLFLSICTGFTWQKNMSPITVIHVKKKKREKVYNVFQVVKHFNTLKHYSNINMVVASPPSALML